MLASLLPGIRHTRTPLVVGSLWLVDLWLILGESTLHPRADRSELEQRLLAAYDIVGPTIGLAALALVAVLLGSLIPEPPRWLRLSRVPIRLGALNRLRDVTRDWAVHQIVFLDGRLRWRDLIIGDGVPRPVAEWERKHEHKGSPDDLLSTDDLIDVVVHSVVEEMDGALLDRVRVTRETLYDEVDRVAAESDLRARLFLPLVVGIVAASVLATPWLLLALVVPYALYYQSLMLRAEWSAMIVGALSAGAIESPSAQYLSGQAAKNLGT